MADITEARKTLPGLVERLRADCDHIRYSCDDIDCVAGPIKKHVHALLDDHERLKSRQRDASDIQKTHYVGDDCEGGHSANHRRIRMWLELAEEDRAVLIPPDDAIRDLLDEYDRLVRRGNK